MPGATSYLNQIMKVSKTFPPVSCKYGAPMGRRDTPPEDPSRPVRLRLSRIRWTDGAYDQGGAYWGSGDPIFCGYNRAGVRLYVRARNEVDACRLILADLAPGSTCAGRVMVNGYPARVDTRKAQSQACRDMIKHLSH